MRKRVLKELNEQGVLHLRDLLRRLNASISELKPLLEDMVKDGLLEKFSHGGYTFYRITDEGRGFLLKLEAESKISEEGESGQNAGGEKEMGEGG